MSAPSITHDVSRPAVIGSQVLGVFIVIFTVLTQQGELHSWRPTGTKTQQIAREDQNGDKFARLWEDPLEDLPTFQVGASLPSATPTPMPNAAAAQSPSPKSSPTATATPTAAQDQGKTPPLASTDSVQYTFLWNIVDARPLPETTERRLRTRYALVSAILAEGYLPLRESILSPLFEAGSENLPAKERKLIGRFETFRKAKSAGQWQYVAVIWTPKKSTKLPIDPDKLNQIETQICQEDTGDSIGTAITVDTIWFLHHGNSDDLSNLSLASASPPPNISFLRATVPLERLAKPPPEGWALLQKITTDDFLVQSLVDELSLRIPALNDPCQKPRIVVFTESDTTYSRAIKAELKKQLKDKNPKVSVKIYSYLRALDGRPDEPQLPEAGESSKSEEATSLLQRRAISETSFGTSQFDYLRRTALDLKERNRSRRNVVAVGILGSDIYDKMLVLQAVRPALPSAIFFTTDLDALYLERAMEPFTRGLVVASADDLDVNESSKGANDQWKLPLMRDSYQTVLVKHIRNILEDAVKQPASARIFEIAAGKRVDLSGTGKISGGLWWLAQGWFNPLIFLPALLNAFLILWAVTTRDPKRPGSMKKGWPWLAYGEATLAGLGLLFLFVALIFFKSNLFFAEPLSLGISIWPSVMIRLLAFAVAILLLCIASHSFADDALPQEKQLKEALAGRIQFPYRAKEGGTPLKRFIRRIRPIIQFLLRKKEGGEPGPDSFHHFFNELFGWNTLRSRIMIISFVYLLISSGLFWYWPTMVPARGASAFLIEKIVLALGVALYIVHLVFCLYLHYCAFRLLRVIKSYFRSEHEQPAGMAIDKTRMLTSLGTLTTVIGKTLLYPLTVLILIILSRLDIFDNWVMTWSLGITFALGAIVLIVASLILWFQGAELKRAVLAQSWPAERDALNAINDGAFAAWYSQPIFSAILSAVAVFGSLSVAGPLTRLFFAY
jgi:hypothetical protein